MDEARERGNLASLTFCQYALEYYRKVNDQGKIEALEKEYSGLKSSVEFGEFTAEIDLSEHMAQCRKVARELAEKEPDEIIKANTATGKWLQDSTLRSIPKRRSLQRRRGLGGRDQRHTAGRQ